MTHKLSGRKLALLGGGKLGGILLRGLLRQGLFGPKDVVRSWFGVLGFGREETGHAQ